jgi:hypothetical protein
MVDTQKGLLDEFLSLSEKYKQLDVDHRLLLNQVGVALQLIQDAWPEPSGAKHLVIDKLSQALADAHRHFKR